MVAASPAIGTLQCPVEIGSYNLSKPFKRTKLDSDSEPETVTALTPSWPHFLVMKDADSESAPIKTLSPFELVNILLQKLLVNRLRPAFNQ